MWKSLLYCLKQKRSNMLVIISLPNQLQVFTVEVLCLRSQLKDILCNSTFSNKYIYPWELSQIATAKIGVSWKIPVCPSTLAHPARMDSGSVNWVILITFNILMTLNPKKIPVLGFKGIDIWIEHNTIDSFSNFPWYGYTKFLLQ